ncbi:MULTISPECIES: bifunctional 2-polyprenyl-6-hydroxyphenol methylase/3-demethylubiquinol 3-O-methyltransferase UbiG [unclassified Crossiella]|uniref:class I SAM-dependent methyltransferase n=1 Tax=unclassified Crossiella TaxID=2620835 RepID=UPI001FFFD3D5|nr:MULTISPECIES: class I SAM-dependent methyltransferase [unclassified Crossiella]MCK2244174.1 class I SAM-dependent methyltransferase [Crossiella sp. S99.2]MCK2257978.1 class I SAM-dependent methyltransferase [Crossiella sp. S99.1]
MDVSTVAVPHTLAHLKPLLPAPPARILEAGCGSGALAAALIELGYQVTGVDRSADVAAAARERGITVIEADVNEVSGEYDVVLFTRSLHHAEDLDGTLTHAATLLAPGGLIVLEEFAWERVDQAAAHFYYDNRALLVATGVLKADVPDGDPLKAWVAGHDFLHRGSDMLDALGRVGSELSTVDTTMLWRLAYGRSGVWTEPATHAVSALDSIRQAEQRRLDASMIPAIGLLATVRR